MRASYYFTPQILPQIELWSLFFYMSTRNKIPLRKADLSRSWPEDDRRSSRRRDSTDLCYLSKNAGFADSVAHAFISSTAIKRTNLLGLADRPRTALKGLNWFSTEQLRDLDDQPSRTEDQGHDFQLEAPVLPLVSDDFTSFGILRAGLTQPEERESASRPPPWRTQFRITGISAQRARLSSVVLRIRGPGPPRRVFLNNRRIRRHARG